MRRAAENDAIDPRIEAALRGPNNAPLVEHTELTRTRTLTGPGGLLRRSESISRIAVLPPAGATNIVKLAAHTPANKRLSKELNIHQLGLDQAAELDYQTTQAIFQGAEALVMDSAPTGVRFPGRAGSMPHHLRSGTCPDTGLGRFADKAMRWRSGLLWDGKFMDKAPKGDTPGYGYNDILHHGIVPMRIENTAVCPMVELRGDGAPCTVLNYTVRGSYRPHDPQENKVYSTIRSKVADAFKAALGLDCILDVIRRVNPELTVGVAGLVPGNFVWTWLDNKILEHSGRGNEKIERAPIYRSWGKSATSDLVKEGSDFRLTVKDYYDVGQVAEAIKKAVGSATTEIDGQQIVVRGVAEAQLKKALRTNKVSTPPRAVTAFWLQIPASTSAA
jgi:hypothetical protein